VFVANGVIVGSHAFALYGNMLGVRWDSETTRTQVNLRQALVESERGFLEIPALNRKAPSTKFRIRGRRLSVDILIPRWAGHPGRRSMFPRPRASRCTSLLSPNVASPSSMGKLGRMWRRRINCCAGWHDIGEAICDARGRLRDPSHRDSCGSFGPRSTDSPMRRRRSCGIRCRRADRRPLSAAPGIARML